VRTTGIKNRKEHEEMCRKQLRRKVKASMLGDREEMPS